jgi:anti-anti-sigma regulatory factor
MAVSLKIEEDKPGLLCVNIEGDLTVQHAAEFKTCLLDALGRAQSVRIDLQAIDDIDLTCLQLLCSAHKTALLVGKDLSLDRERPEPLERSLDLAGFSRSRGCTIDENDSCLWIQRRQP